MTSGHNSKRNTLENVIHFINRHQDVAAQSWGSI